MASIRKEFALAAPAVWAALRDVGAVHTRLAPGFVTDCRMDGRERIVTFANGTVARELIVDVDDNARRLACSARTSSIEHHHAFAQVFDDGPGRCRLLWIADVLPRARDETPARPPCRGRGACPSARARSGPRPGSSGRRCHQTR